MKSLQSVLHALSFDAALARLFSSTPWESVEHLAEWVSANDPYGEEWAISRALGLTGSDSPDPLPHIAHQLWCAHRQAAWTSDLAEPLPIRTDGLAHLAETEGHPTLLVTPMTLAPADALSAIARLNASERPCIVFGEDVDAGELADAGRLEIVSGMSGATVRRILEVLNEGGILCTYPDFVYDGRAAETLSLFGTRRPVSSGFISLAARHGTMLLPVLCMHEGDGVAVRIDEPTLIEDHGRADATARSTARARVAGVIGELLEALIRRAPEQWLLLPTLTFESPEMAVTRAVAAGAASPSPEIAL